MAENVSATGRKRRDSAGELPDNDPATAPVKEPSNIATEEDMQRAFAIYKNAETTYDAFLATQRAAKTAAKSVRDKALTDSVVIVASRGMTKKTMRKIYERSLLEAEELIAEVKAEVWGMRAAGLPIGTQLAFFDGDNSFGNEDEMLRRAYQKGRDAAADNKNDTDNPFHPSSPPGQKWMQGLIDARGDILTAKAH